MSIFISRAVASYERNSIPTNTFYIEPASMNLKLPDTWKSWDIVKFSGQFYKYKGFPKEYRSEELPERAKVFRYTIYKIIKSNYRNVINEIGEQP